MKSFIQSRFHLLSSGFFARYWKGFVLLGLLGSSASLSAQGGRQRPSFIPQTEPTQAFDTPAPAPTATIITQVEIPAPPPTAQPLEIPGSIPSGVSSSSSQSDAHFLRETAPSQSASTGSIVYGGNTAPAHHSPTPSSPPSAPVFPGSEAPTPQPTSSQPVYDISPTIIYDDRQEGISRPVRAPEVEMPLGPDPGALLRQRRYSEVEPLALDTRDSPLASALGWAYYQGQQYDRAYQWFERAIQWDENNYEAAYGMALVLFRQGQYTRAAEVANWRLAEYPRMRRILEDIATRQAVTSFQNKNYQTSLRQLEEIRKRRGLTREEEIMVAWNRYHLGDVSGAKTAFLRLYQRRPDRASADGVYTTFAATRSWQELRTLAEERGGPLRAIYQRHVGEQYYSYGLHRRALVESRNIRGKYPELQGIDSPSVGVELTGRSRSGTAGTSELTEYSGTLTGTLYGNALHRFDLSVSLTDLNSGPLARDTPMGKVPSNANASYRYRPETSYTGLFSGRLRWEYEGLFTPYVELGFTPTEGPVSPTFVGTLGGRRTEDWGSWNVELYRDPVKDSILSYIGQRDPYTGTTWGRVTETGARFSLYAQMENRWSFYGAASAGVRTGRHVRSNSHVALSLAVSKSLDYEWFEYLTVGPSLAVEFFDKNLSGFTYGHGGYFSPSHMIQLMVGARFMTHQGRNSLVRGSVGLGIQNNKQDSVPWFPNQADHRWITGQSATGAALLFDIEGLYQLSDQWVVGGALAFNMAPEYNDFALRLSLRYFFDPRAGLFEQDFMIF